MITTKELRLKFTDYFKSKQHSYQSSSSLITFDDDTLLFTNAGMVQFKDVFLGIEKKDFTCAVSVQKCLRAGGKHNDLDNVGYTARHHTFFEMLGNFSFGDYFKSEAINFAWEFLTKEINLPIDKLWVTVYETDTQAFDIWHNQIGLPIDRIIKINTSDNFWSMGDTGPCGPCSEIFYDHGESIPGGLPGTPEEDGDRYVEIWNLVFMQYNRQKDGTMLDLPKPSVDTGMGLERIAAILQHVTNNYDIDLFQNLINKTIEITNTKEMNSASLKVVADHIRSCAFLIADGVIPSNEGRGYVLRRIIRRAVRHGNKLGAEGVFFYKIVDSLIAEMGEAYPELIEKKSLIEKTLIKEEELFFKTIENGIRIFDAEINNLVGYTISGEVAFKLYDTYGFPLDLTADMARERGLKIDVDAFKNAMDKQKKRSKESGKFNVDYATVISSDSKSQFKGYSSLIQDAKVIEIFVNGKSSNTIQEGEEAVIILDKTPLYAESGGQVGDHGLLVGVGVEFIVEDVQKSGDAILHIGKLVKGLINVSDELNARVDVSSRLNSSSNHSATHILHKSLKLVLGTHVEQKGSLVDTKRLRFDFMHDSAMSINQIQQVEELVNKQIRMNYQVLTIETNQDRAIAMGAEALFGEKYGDIVRVISMGDFSVELCGGTHVSRTGDIGLFKILSETGVAAGIRRIEAITSEKAIQNMFAVENKIENIKNILKSDDENIIEKIQTLQNSLRSQEKQISKLKKDLLSGRSNTIKETVYGDITLAIANIEGVDVKTLREKTDDYKSKNDKVVTILSTIVEEKVQFVIGVSKSISLEIKAGDIAKELSKYIDGKGGGRPDMAQGGGNAPGKIDLALSYVEEFVENKIKKIT